jgi:hypothetical protein
VSGRSTPTRALVSEWREAWHSPSFGFLKAICHSCQSVIAYESAGHRRIWERMWIRVERSALIYGPWNVDWRQKPREDAMTFDARPIEHRPLSDTNFSTEVLLGELARLGSLYGYSRETVCEFLGGFREVLGTSSTECSWEPQDPEIRRIVELRYFLQPLAYLAVLTAAAPVGLLLRELMKREETTWFGVLHKAFGTRRMLRLQRAFERHHLELAGKEPGYAVYLVRLGEHWQNKLVVATALNQLKTPGLVDERQRSRLLRLLADQIRPESSVRDGGRGRPHSHCENFYLLERWNELAGNALAKTLASECRTLFGGVRAERRIHMQLYRLR